MPDTSDRAPAVEGPSPQGRDGVPRWSNGGWTLVRRRRVLRLGRAGGPGGARPPASARPARPRGSRGRGGASPGRPAWNQRAEARRGRATRSGVRRGDGVHGSRIPTSTPGRGGLWGPATPRFPGRDGDAFGDDAIGAPRTAGPAVGAPGYSAAFRGCRLVELRYRRRRRPGRVRSTDGDRPTPDTRRARARPPPRSAVTRLEGSSRAAAVGRGETSARTGRTSMRGRHLPGRHPPARDDVLPADRGGRHLRLRHEPLGQVVEIRDGDGDSSRTTDNPGAPAGEAPTQRPGCPTLARGDRDPYAGGAVSVEA